MQQQVTANLFMVRPINFKYNDETALSNKFQHKENLDDETLNSSAQKMFDEFVEQLKFRNINVIIFEDTKTPFTPDSIFPNNWISMHFSGKAILYPMEAENRRSERREDIIEYLKENFDVNEIIDLTYLEKENKFLEGTGSLVIDRINRIAYACISSRTSLEALEVWKSKMDGYEVETFTATDQNGDPVYHTNVLMCMGDNFCVICLESISDLDERLALKQKIEKSGKEIIEISLDQMNNFAGNMLLVKNTFGKKYLIMSQKAYNSLTPSQISNLDEKAEIFACELGVIETIGGGSARCMIAEIHMPKK